jgi:hypothetical protein
MTITTGELVRRNANFAASGAFADLPFPANQTFLRVIGCVAVRNDHRVVAAIHRLCSDRLLDGLDADVLLPALGLHDGARTVLLQNEIGSVVAAGAGLLDAVAAGGEEMRQPPLEGDPVPSGRSR